MPDQVYPYKRPKYPEPDIDPAAGAPWRQYRWSATVAATALAAFLVTFWSPPLRLPAAGWPASLSLPAALSPSCTIKGNVSIETGERIYHAPGQRYYSRTVISPEYGERWFCSEEEARRAGWRRSKV